MLLSYLDEILPFNNIFLPDLLKNSSEWNQQRIFNSNWPCAEEGPGQKSVEALWTSVLSLYCSLARQSKLTANTYIFLTLKELQCHSSLRIIWLIWLSHFIIKNSESYHILTQLGFLGLKSTLKYYHDSWTEMKEWNTIFILLIT